MLSLLKKTASVCLTLLGQRKFLFFLGVFCSMGMGYGQTLTIVDVSVAEDVAGGNLVFEVTLDNPVALGTDVTYSFVDVTATGGTDYDNTGGILNFVGTASEIQTITVPITNDAIVEVDETFQVILGTPSNGVGVVGSPATGTITNDDTAILTITDVSVAEDVAGGNLVFEVTLDNPVALGTDVTYSFVDVTATGGTDYDNTGGTLNFVGTASEIQIITVPITNDATVEGDETFQVILGTPSNGVGVVGSPATGTITNDDTAILTITDVSVAEDVVGGNLVFEVTLDNEVALGTDVTYSFVDVTATGGTDYDNTGGTLNFVGTASEIQIITVPITNDATVEGDETFQVILGTPSNGVGVVGSPATGTITNDDVNPPSGYGVTIDQSLITDANETSVSFTFSGAEVNADYNYTFTSDGGGTPVIGSGTIANADQQIVGIDVSGLADGVITLSVTLTNDGGIGSPVTDTADKDTAAPAGYSVTINQVAIDANNEDAITFTINSAQLFSMYSYTFTSSGGGTPVTGNGGPILSTNPTIPILGGIDLSSLPDGTIQLSVVLSDLFGPGNPATDSVIKYTAVPSGYGVNINQILIDETNETAVSFGFTGAEVGADYEYTFSSDGGGTVGPISGTISTATDNVTGIDLSGLGNGTITLSVTLSNTNGIGNAATDTVTKNTCFSGTMAPTLDNSVPTAFCNSFSQDLDDYVANTPPTGSVLRWSTNSNTSVTGDYLGSSTVSATGTYYGFFYDAVNDCASNVLQITITDCSNVCPTAPSAPPLDASEPTVFCDVINVDLDDYLTSTAAPAGTVLTWSVDPDPLETDAHLISSNVVDPGSYYGFFYDESNDCASPVLQITLVRNYTPEITETMGDAVCVTGDAILTATATLEEGEGNTITYNWYDAPEEGNLIGTGNTLEIFSVTETTFYYVSASANGCVSERVEVVATVNETPLAGVPLEGISVCNVTSDEGPTTLDLDETLIGQDAGTWTVVTDPSNGTLEIGAENIVDFTGLPSGDYVFEYTTNVAVSPCEDATVQVTVSVLDCVSNAAIDLAITKELKDEIAYLLGDPITFVITLENVEGKTVTDIVVSDLLDDAFEYVDDVASLGTYDPDTGEWTISNLAATDATATLEITVISTTAGTLQNTATLLSSFPNDGVASNNTATVSVQVNRSQCEDPGTICNIFSPDGDGINDLLTLVGHISYPNNTFEVFDRYGNSVFQMDGYNSTWDGTGKNGDLPKGTYFYLLDLGDGSEVVKGWIQIVRKD
ncbi:Calx-beta domain-containing protein [Allomuricauda taeanensis]|uniref:Calx-beta domain-containing protein n=1 Tax=Flagellimonas taeanensis TaxID=1005926 RepID=UPI002E7AEBCC|nr:Calx-beta domain-containing protein [Allomuricauda taeanensis]MEE1962237.1 Calx-beta domain-containing protein [Allomuricauda taeanensis]